MNVLWCPIFSMRSYATGKYSILKDGNFQLTMSRALASNFEKITITVPENSSDFNEAIERFKDKSNIELVQAAYGLNAVDTRDNFWSSNYHWIRAGFELDSAWDLLISDITGYPGSDPVIYNFNITKLPELDRPYVDRFFETDLKSIEQSVFTTVLNPRQREYILECRSDLADKVIVNLKCAHADLLPIENIWGANPQEIFWPFRISDKAYKWTEFVQEFENQNLHKQGFTVTITDPNESIGSNFPSWVKRLVPSKTEYYRILASRPTIVMLDDIDTVLHPGTIEFFHYRCPVLTFTSKLIWNPNAIRTLSDLSIVLCNLSDHAVKTDRFVYSAVEIDSIYNEHYINQILIRRKNA